MSDLTEAMMLKEMRRLERVRRDFVANVSHELRTPISVIRANAETLLEVDVEKDFSKTLIEAILRHSERLTALVDDLLDLSRIEAGHLSLKIQTIDVFTALEKIVTSHQKQATLRNTQIDLQVTPQLYCQADTRAFDQVLSNLLDNAIKYTPKNGRVILRAFLQNNHVRFEIEDNGVGIEQKHLSRIFERFYRVDLGRSREVGGTGLGLSIVKHLVEAMHGSVGVQAIKPHGSLFWVHFTQSSQSL